MNVRGPIIVTGASGFLGQAVLDALLRENKPVIALSRKNQAEAEGVEWVKIDLSRDAALAPLTSLLREKKPSAIIHLAGQMTSDDRDHVAHTVKPTRRLVEALRQSGADASDWPLIVHASSFSVYSYTGQPTGSLLDETTPTELAAHRRDAYTRAKLAQEAILRSAAQKEGLRVRILRPGAIVGKGREWTPRIGLEKGPIAILLGGGAALPLIDVKDCARAFCLAAITPLDRSDIYCDGHGALELINVIGDNRPSQKDYLSTIRQKGLSRAKLALPFPWKILEKGSELLGVGMDLWPWLERKTPGLLRPETLHARAKPLKFSNARLKDRLQWEPVTDREPS